MPKSLKFNHLFFRDFWDLLKLFWCSEQKYIAMSFLMLNIICIVIEIGSRVAINEFSKNFYNAIQAFNQTALISALEYFSIVLIILAAVMGYSFYLSGLISIRWRNWLTKNFLDLWINNQNLYHGHTQLDNPDQRICDDIEKFTTSTVNLFFVLIHSVLIVSVFGYILWDLSKQFVFFVQGYLFWCAFLYALVGTLLMGWIGKNLANLNYKMQAVNADFRFSLVKFRESTERVEAQYFSNLFQPILKNFMQVLKVKRRLTFFSNGYNTASFILGLMIAIPQYFKRKILLGGLMQISGAFSYVMGGFSVFVNSYHELSELRAVVHRLGEFRRVGQMVITSEAQLSHPKRSLVIQSASEGSRDIYPHL